MVCLFLLKSSQFDERKKGGQSNDKNIPYSVKFKNKNNINLIESDEKLNTIGLTQTKNHTHLKVKWLLPNYYKRFK